MDETYDDLDSFFDNSEIRFKEQSPVKFQADDAVNRLYIVLFGSVVSLNQLVGGYIKINAELISEGKLFLDVCSMVECFFYKDEDPNIIFGGPGKSESKIHENIDTFHFRIARPRTCLTDEDFKTSLQKLPFLNLKDEPSKNHRTILYDESIELFDFDKGIIKEAILILPFKLDIGSMLTASKSCRLKLDKVRRMRVKLYHTLTCRLESKFKPRVLSYGVPLTIIEHKPPDDAAKVSKFVDGKYRCSMTLSHTVIHPKASRIEIMVTYDRNLPYQYATFVIECRVSGSNVQDNKVEVIKDTILLNSVQARKSIKLEVEAGSGSPKPQPLLTTQHILDLKDHIPAMESVTTENLQISFCLHLQLSRVGRDPKVERAVSHAIVLTRIPSRQYHISTDKRSLLYQKIETVSEESRIFLPFTNIVLNST